MGDIILTAPDAKIARLAASLRLRGFGTDADPDTVVVKAFLWQQAVTEFNAIDKLDIEAQLATEEAKPVPDATVIKDLLYQRHQLAQS